MKRYDFYINYDVEVNGIYISMQVIKNMHGNFALVSYRMV